MDQPAEEWRDVVGYEGTFSVSNLGRVRRDRLGRGVKGVHCLAPTLNRKGYPVVSLAGGRVGAHKTVPVHTMVCAAFLGPRPYALQVNHRDGIKTNNALRNLEYATRSQNIQHMYDVIGHRAPYGERCGASKLTEREVVEIRRLRDGGRSLRVVGELFGISKQAVRQITNRLTWRHI